ncbi:MAG: hypothetical protein ACP5D2_04150 [Candidatus Nanoarchaeia archaeon]
MDYSQPEKRKTRRDKKAKRKYRVYKKGGRFRDKNVEEGKGKKKKK